MDSFLLRSKFKDPRSCGLFILMLSRSPFGVAAFRAGCYFLPTPLPLLPPREGSLTHDTHLRG
jgi:hypothetical protein